MNISHTFSHMATEFYEYRLIMRCSSFFNTLLTRKIFACKYCFKIDSIALKFLYAKIFYIKTELATNLRRLTFADINFGEMKFRRFAKIHLREVFVKIIY